MQGDFFYTDKMGKQLLTFSKKNIEKTTFGFRLKRFQIYGGNRTIVMLLSPLYYYMQYIISPFDNL